MLFQRWKKWGETKSLALFNPADETVINSIESGASSFLYWRSDDATGVSPSLHSRHFERLEKPARLMHTALDRVGTSQNTTAFYYLLFLQDRFFFIFFSFTMQHFFFFFGVRRRERFDTLIAIASLGRSFFKKIIFSCVSMISATFFLASPYTHTCVTSSTWRVSIWPSPWQRQTYCSIPNLLWILIETFEFGNVLILCRP